MRRFAVAVAVVVASLVVPSLAGAASGPISIRVLSTRADLVSGGQVLAEVDGASAGSFRAVLDGRDVSHEFALRPDGAVQALLTGLKIGPNQLTVLGANSQGARLTITDHPIGGPVIAGPQTQPWICNNTTYGLGAPTDAQCDTPPVITYQYKDATTGQMQTYDPNNPPSASSIATTTTDEGKTVAYIVRIETGVIDRGTYQLEVLDNPAKPVSPFDPALQPGWNQKLYWAFGGQCTPDHNQEAPTGINTSVVAMGFLSGASSDTNLGSDCNSVVSAETLMMLKEHIVDTYGQIEYTMSEGCSGGSMQQNWIASDYPGLLNGIQPSCSFPDLWETMQEAQDCYLLKRVFDGHPAEWPAAIEGVVTGYGSPSVCAEWANTYGKTWVDPANAPACVGGISFTGVGVSGPSWAYNPMTNPTGTRCTIQDYMVSIFGQRPKSAWGAVEQQIGHGFANRPFDNVGVQYGLNALLSGEITAQQFVDLNQQVGGGDIDWNHTSARSVADPAALQVAYRAGLVVDQKQAASVPTIDLRGGDDAADVHTDFHSYVERARLDRANGNHDNQIIWTGLPSPPVSYSGDSTAWAEAVRLLDQWLGTIHSDRRDVSLATKVGEDKPQEAVDACWVAGHRITDAGVCRAAFPYFSDPRIAAGGPWTDDVLKCQLRPLDSSQYYGVTFTAAQWAELQQLFPDGVCNYGVPGVDQVPSVPWMTFAHGPGGQPLGPAPTSTTFTAR
jgi:hypothetical protein